jgi:protein-disulfide isomerase
MTMNKRDEIKAARTRKKRRRRMNTLLGVGGFIVLIVLLLISPTIYNNLKPAGSFVKITPVAYPLENGKAIGNPNAKVKIQAYEDFQCTSCKTYVDNVEMQLLTSTYISSGEVYYEILQYPFIDTNTITKESQQAANASMCAMDQGKFWAYHDILYANQGIENGGSFNDKRLVAFAESIGLDMTQFNQCFSSNKHASEINAEHQQGVSLGVTGTPTLFLNGTQITPGFVPSYDQVKSAIDAALASGG